jgi:leucine-rich repeat protein SHOC2
MRDLTNLVKLNINGNPLRDLSILQALKKLKSVVFLGATLQRRYWIKISEWKSEWILDEKDDRIRRFIIDRLGVDRILEDLSQISIPFKLNLGSYQLASLLEGIDKLINLYELRIDRNNLTTVPSGIGKLFALKSLDVSNNQIASLPNTISQLKKLEQLYARSNKLTRISASACNLTNLIELGLDRNQISMLPENIGNLVNLVSLDLSDNCLEKLPASIGRCHKLKKLDLGRNPISELPETFCNLSNLQDLRLQDNHLQELPDSLTDKCRRIEHLDLGGNKLAKLPETFGNLTKLRYLYLQGNTIRLLPAGIANLIDLKFVNLNLNPIEDLSMFQYLPELTGLQLFGVNLPRRYWTKFSEWQAEWLLDEYNVEIRRRLIEYLGYEKICNGIGAIEIDRWQEYTLLEIGNIEIVYQGWKEIGREPMMLLKMTCPSTAHIHILRVPPDMTRAEDAIVWVNHGIHPSKFSIQT